MLVWAVEWQLASANRRGMAFRVIGALVVALVITTGAVPNGVGHAALVALLVGYGLLRSAIEVLGDEQSGIERRVLSAGVSPAGYLLQKAGASAALSLLGLLPAVAIVALSFRMSPVEILLALGALAVSLWTASVLGVVIGTVSRSGSEVVLLGVVTLLLLLHMSGVFHTPTPDGLAAVLEQSAPFRLLHEALVSTTSGSAIGGGAAAAAWAVLVAALAGFFAPRLTAFPARG
jgi:hypothetical protein